MNEITVVVVGYEEDQLTDAGKRALREAERVILHTEQCGCASWLQKQGIAYSTLDYLYDATEDFDDHAIVVAETLIDAAKQTPVCYAVFNFRDRSLGELLNRAGNITRFIGGSDPAAVLLAGVCSGVLDVSASEWSSLKLTSSEGVLIRELDRREIACELKLRLMDVYPEETDVAVLMSNGEIVHLPLYTLDRLTKYDHKTCAYIPAIQDYLKLERYDVNRFEEIIDVLLGPHGCPWDRAQTHKSLRPYVLEEAYEAVDAIDSGNPEHLCEELGDLLLQIVLHAGIAKKHGDFTMNDIATTISRKMITRHTHIFGEEYAGDEESVAALWVRNKMKERHQTTQSERLRDIPKTFPASMRAVKIVKRIQEACSKDFNKERVVDQMRDKLMEAGDAEQRLGEMQLQLMILCYLEGVDPEVALNRVLETLVMKYEKLEKSGSVPTEIWNTLWSKET